MSWLRQHRYRIPRRIVQVSILTLLWAGASLHLPVLVGNLSSSTLLGTVPLADPFAVLQILLTGQHLPQSLLLGAGLVVLFYLLVGGRSFCSWVCPVNLITDSARALRTRLGIRSHFSVHRSARMWIMGLALVVSAVSGVAAFEWISPIGMIHRELIFTAGSGLLAALVIFLLDLLVLRQGWCGSLCPLGALYSLIGRLSPTRVAFIADRCDRCGDCLPVCPESHVIHFKDMEAAGFILSGDCTNCGRCLEACTRDAYHFGARIKKNNHSQQGTPCG